MADYAVSSFASDQPAVGVRRSRSDPAVTGRGGQHEQRIDHFALVHLKIQVRTRRAARVAYVLMAGRPHLLLRFVDGRSVRNGSAAVAVVDDNEHAANFASRHTWRPSAAAG